VTGSGGEYPYGISKGGGPGGGGWWVGGAAAAGRGCGGGGRVGGSLSKKKSHRIRKGGGAAGGGWWAAVRQRGRCQRGQWSEGRGWGSRGLVADVRWRKMKLTEKTKG
jgi:hypothetical protein